MGSTITLPTSLRGRLERAFATPLDDLRIETGLTARRVVEGAGGRFGCAVEGRVFLADPPPSLRFAVLAHEVAHAVQQRHRRRRAPDPAPLIEAEAQDATASLLAGRQHPISCVADPREPALWGEAGHYYTVYFVALAAGAPKMDAYRIAFWAQVPDEVEDFDAKRAGMSLLVSDRIRVPEAKRLELQKHWESIQRGLHCLTGRSADQERALRRRVSSGYKRPEGSRLIEFGVSLHAFGDSYAHSIDGQMPPPPLGHGPWGEAPDRLSPARQPVYLDYVGALYDVFATIYPPPTAQRLSREETLAALATIIPPIPKIDERCLLSDPDGGVDQGMPLPNTAVNPAFGTPAFKTMCDGQLRLYRAVTEPTDDDERKQIQAIRRLADAIGPMEPYDPENKDALWLASYKPPPDVGWYPGVENLVQELIKRWDALK